MLMRFFAAAGIAATAFLAAPSNAASTIAVTNVWSRPADTTGVVYATIKNTATTADALVSAASPVAKSVEIHETVAASPGSMSSSSMKDMPGMSDSSGIVMRPVKKIAIPAGGSVELKPGGYHIMLVGLSHELKAGDTIPITLTFQNAGAVPVVSHVQTMSQ